MESVYHNPKLVSFYFPHLSCQKALSLLATLFCIPSFVCVAQVVLPRGLQPWLTEAFNRNMLPLFLVANLATGMVNLSVYTLDVPDQTARCIVVVYAAIICGLAAALDALDIRIGLKR